MLSSMSETPQIFLNNLKILSEDASLLKALSDGIRGQASATHLMACRSMRDFVTSEAFM